MGPVGGELGILGVFPVKRVSSPTELSLLVCSMRIQTVTVQPWESGTDNWRMSNRAAAEWANGSWKADVAAVEDGESVECAGDRTTSVPVVDRPVSIEVREDMKPAGRLSDANRVEVFADFAGDLAVESGREADRPRPGGSAGSREIYEKEKTSGSRKTTPASAAFDRP